MIGHPETPKILSDPRTAPISQIFKASSKPAAYEPIAYSTAVYWGSFGRGTADVGIGGAILKHCHPFPVRLLEHNLMEATRKGLSDGSTAEMFDQGEGELVSGGFRLKLGLDVRSEQREAPLIMELVVPLYTLPMAEYIDPFLDILDSHHKLSDISLLHRDISSANMMHLPHTSEKLPVQGVLIDFDFLVDKNGPATHYDKTLTHRTGTLPFLALDILRARAEELPTHIPRFDLESFVYVFIWLVICYPNGKAARYTFEEHPLRSWLSADLKIHTAAKMILMIGFDTYDVESFESLNLAEFNLCIEPLENLLRELMNGTLEVSNFRRLLAKSRAATGPYIHPDGRVEEMSWERANETLLGHFTHEIVKNTFMSIKEALLESLPV